MTWRTAHQAIAAVRRRMAARRGGTIGVHQEDCALEHGDPCNCTPRLLVVRPPGRRHNPADHDCRGGVKGDRYPL